MVFVTVLVLCVSIMSVTSNAQDVVAILEGVTDQQCKPEPLSVFYNFLVGSEKPLGYITCAKNLSEAKDKTNPDDKLTSNQLILRYGYPLEVHKVETKDGYILTVHRIPNNAGKPVYLQHGLGASSDTWLQIAKKSLAFLLADTGYDVWLGNFRGTNYSLGHIDPNMKWDDKDNISYWDFSWHEMGKYDIPAVIEYIVDQTNQTIFYVAHSMGTTSMMVAIDEDADFINENVDKLVFLATCGLVGRCVSPIALVGPVSDDKNRKAADLTFRGKLESPNEWLEIFNTSLADICTPTAARCGACPFLIYALFGFDAPQTNYTNVPNLVNRYPNIISTKTLWHYGQIIWNCNFCQYDYGKEGNQQRYNRGTPPCYKLDKAKVPLYAFYGAMDNTCVPEDSERTLELFPPGIVKLHQKVDWKLWTHADHVIAKDADKLLYDCVKKVLKVDDIKCD